MELVLSRSYQAIPYFPIFPFFEHCGSQYSRPQFSAWKMYVNIYDKATLKDFRGKQKCFRNKDDTKMRSTFIEKSTTRLFVFFRESTHTIYNYTYVTAGIKRMLKRTCFFGGWILKFHWVCISYHGTSIYICTQPDREGFQGQFLFPLKNNF